MPVASRVTKSSGWKIHPHHFKFKAISDYHLLSVIFFFKSLEIINLISVILQGSLPSVDSNTEFE